MKILIVGSGSFVFDDMYGPGVILRSVVQWCLDTQDDHKKTIILSYHSSEKLPEKKAKAAEILNEFSALSHDIAIEFIPSADIASVIENGDLASCFIAVPDQFHALYTRLCIENNCPVWIVKPLTGNLVEAKELQDLCKARNGRVWVDYHKRFDTSNALLKTKLQADELGQALVYSVDYHQPYILPTQVFDWAKDVDVFSYIGCHYVDQVFYLYPDAVLKSVYTSGVKGQVFEKTGQFDCVLANLTFQHGTHTLHVPMNVGWSNPKGSPTKSLQTLKVQCENGIVNLDQTRRGVQIWQDDGVSEINPYFFCKIKDIFGRYRYEGYGFESVKTFLDLVRTDAVWASNQSLPTLNEAVKTEHVLDAVKQSLISKR
ncbi:Gfo/Idh/MocA family protein [Kordiimonas aquimaris]|uniref:Gfo/Idh/MocA family protein n=1 Tax=Kordiimonas aquimaris TaxID=707591 RepID=UPI0021D2BDD9|nr:Gfo/Idh/MocA family oxidoreductase [Kordiimonas aquimaris]